MNHPERDLQKSMVTWLRHQKPDAVWFHVPNGGKRNVKTAAMLKAMGTLAGVSDLCFVLEGGKVGFVEVKAGKGRLTDNQKAFRDEVTAKGAYFAEAKSIEELRAALVEMGAL